MGFWSSEAEKVKTIDSKEESFLGWENTPMEGQNFAHCGELEIYALSLKYLGRVEGHWRE